MQRGLDALISPRSRSEVLGDEPFAIHGLTDAIAPLREIGFLASIDALLGSWPQTVQVHLPDAADEASAISASPRDARKLFDNGMSLLFDDAHVLSPVLGAWLEALRADLGFSLLTQSRCLMYATPRGGGTAPHFDQNVNVVIQLHGEKTWWVAQNRNVVHPMTRHTIGLPIDHELATYVTAPMPSEMPAERRAIVLSPGSLLVVPRGVWHATEAATDALALNFTFTAPTWIDVFSAALRGQLARSAAWRATATPRNPDELERLVRALAREASTWNAVDILATTELE